MIAYQLMCHFAYRLVKLPTSDKQEYEHVNDQVLGGLGCSEFFLACVLFLKREELIKDSPRGQSESDIGLDFHSFRCFFYGIHSDGRSTALQRS